MLWVHNDLLLALDKGQDAILILLDYSAAFDTISHNTLIHRLQERFGICGSVLNWVKSYLINRSQSVVIGKNESLLHFPGQGVPQGSVAGPLIFTLYSSPLENVINHHGIGCMMYADDTQIYITFKQNEKSSSILNVQNCLNDIKVWSTKNGLKLNESKTN